MKRTKPFLLSILLSLCSAAATAAENEVFFCGQDISDSNNFYRFENFRNKISLLPNDGSNAAAYDAIYKIYLNRLERTQERTRSVQNFLFMLEEIVAGLTSADIEIESVADAEQVVTGETTSAVIHCSDLDNNRGAIQDIGYIVIAIQKIYDEGWFSLSQEVDRRVKLLSLRYDQWLQNGVDIWPHEYYLNKQLVEGSEKPSSLRRGFFKKYQFTFFRPHVGFAGEVDSPESDKVHLALGIDVLGFVKYTRRDYSSHWGLSIAFIAPEDQDSGIGIIYRKNNFSIGIARNDDDEDSIFLGIDILGLVNEDLPYVRRIRVDAASSDGKP